MRFSTKAALASLVLAAAGQAGAAPAFDQFLASDIIYGGGGNDDGGFTVDAIGTIELGLRAHVRWPVPQNVFNSNGDGTYSHLAGPGTPPSAAMWNFDFSVNSNRAGTPGGPNLTAYNYTLGIDYDPSASATYDTFNLNTFVFLDNSFGNNSTANGAGTDATPITYLTLLASNNVMQNSFNLDFFNEYFGEAFNPSADGNYSFYLAAFDQDGRQLARTDITVIVGAGAPPAEEVPEPASIALAGLALAGLGLARRRRR